VTTARHPAPGLANYAWPHLPGSAGAAPRWENDGFRLAPGTSPQSVLTYAQSESHWSEELTELHEAEAGDGDHPIDRASRALALHSLRQHLPQSPGVVLDVGCSSGFFLRDFRRAQPSVPIIGADYIPGPLHKLASALPGVPLLQFDLRTCPLPADSLAAIVCLNVLEHIDLDQQALGHMHRILQPGGIAHVEVPAGPGCYDIYDEHLMHHRRYTMAELTAKARQAGFRVLSRTHLGALVYPAFYFVKRRNRRHLTLPPAEKAALIGRMMRNTRKSTAMELAMRLELFLGRAFAYPLGIRCVAVLQKS
jgi:SAM-dependent methyltransferase